MDTASKHRLGKRIVEEVQTMLTEGDRSHLRELSREALLETVETELKFLGLYSHDDEETPVMIHMILRERLDQLCEAYLFGSTVQIAPSPFIQETSSEGVGRLHPDVTHDIGFMPHMERSHIQVSSALE